MDPPLSGMLSLFEHYIKILYMKGANTMADKICKIYPGNNKVTYIPGIMPNRGRLELPARAKLNEGELRKCLSYATVYEEVDGKNVLLTLNNFNKDNTDGIDATIPTVELKNYVKDEEPASPAPAKAAKATVQSKTRSNETTTKTEADTEDKK